jgi:hypothetical protein
MDEPESVTHSKKVKSGCLGEGSSWVPAGSPLESGGGHRVGQVRRQSTSMGVREDLSWAPD